MAYQMYINMLKEDEVHVLTIYRFVFRAGLRGYE